jgi:DNA polymerase III epsilon subunit family exonuclease
MDGYTLTAPSDISGKGGIRGVRGPRRARPGPGGAGDPGGGGFGAPTAKMSVGGSTVVCVMRPTVVSSAPRGAGSAGVTSARLVLAGRVPAEAELARPELAVAEPGRLELAGAGLAGAGLAGAGLATAEPCRLELAGAELAEVEFAVIDLETTGWSPEAAAITEIATVRVRGGRRMGEFASLVNPGVPVPAGIEDLTGISDWMLAAAPRLAAVLPGLLAFADGCVLVAHNAPFDIGFLSAACAQCGLAWPGFTVLDTVMLARRVMDPDEVPDCKLGTLAGFFRTRTAPSHRALADARATADVLGWLIRRLTHHGVRTLSQLSAWAEVVA